MVGINPVNKNSLAVLIPIWVLIHSLHKNKNKEKQLYFKWVLWTQDYSTFLELATYMGPGLNCNRWAEFRESCILLANCEYLQPSSFLGPLLTNRSAAVDQMTCSADWAHLTRKEISPGMGNPAGRGERFLHSGRPYSWTWLQIISLRLSRRCEVWWFTDRLSN